MSSASPTHVVRSNSLPSNPHLSILQIGCTRHLSRTMQKPFFVLCLPSFFGGNFATAVYIAQKESCWGRQSMGIFEHFPDNLWKLVPVQLPTHTLISHMVSGAFRLHQRRFYEEYCIQTPRWEERRYQRNIPALFGANSLHKILILAGY